MNYNTEKVLTVNEINSACDSPIVDPDTKHDVYHGSNFHGNFCFFLKWINYKKQRPPKLYACRSGRSIAVSTCIQQHSAPFVPMGYCWDELWFGRLVFTATSPPQQSATELCPIRLILHTNIPHAAGNNGTRDGQVGRGGMGATGRIALAEAVIARKWHSGGHAVVME